MTVPERSAVDRPLTTPLARAEWLDPRFQRLIVVQLAFGYVFSSLLVSPKFLTAALSASPLELGELNATTALAGIVAAPFCGRWLDRGGARAAMLAGSLLLALSAGSFGWLTTISPALFALRAAQGIGNTLVIGGSAALVTEFVRPRHHGRAFGLAGAAALGMNAVGAPGTESLAAAHGWGLAYSVTGAAGLLSLAVSFTLPSERAETGGAPTSRSPVSTRSSGPIAWGALAAGVGFATLATYTQPYALERGAERISALFIGYTLTALFVRLALGDVADRWGRRKCATLAVVGYALTLLAAAFLEPSWLFFLGLGFGLSHGLAWPSLNALAAARATPGHAGSALAHLHALFGVGSIAGVWGSGYLAGVLGYPASFALAAAVVAAGAVSLGYPRRLASRE